MALSGAIIPTALPLAVVRAVDVAYRRLHLGVLGITQMGAYPEFRVQGGLNNHNWSEQNIRQIG